MCVRRKNIDKQRKKRRTQGKIPFLQNLEQEYTQLKTDFGNKRSAKQLLSFSDAQKNATAINWDNFKPVKPTFTGTKVFDAVSTEDLLSYIDWNPFFIS